MKKIVILLVLSAWILSVKGQQTFIITAVDFSFSPSEVTASVGDTVRFQTGALHRVVQVSQATWNTNGSTQLSGGFLFYPGDGDFIPQESGTYYYVCSFHVATSGMKGLINVNTSTGIEDPKDDSVDKIYPVPAHDFINYQTSNSLSVNEIMILDITGKTVIILQEPVFLDGNLRIDINDLVDGIYLLIVKTDKGSISKKFMKSD